MSSAGLNIEDLRQLVKRDLEASNELQARIDHIRKEIDSGEQPARTEVSALGVEHKAIGRDLVHRIDQIEGQQSLTAADRNMLQGLTARLGVHDLQSARIAELGDLLVGNKAWLKSDERPKSPGSAAKVSSGSKASPDSGSGKRSPPAPLLEPATPPTESLELTARSSPDALRHTISYDEEDEDDGTDDYSIVSEDGSEAEVDKSSWPLLYRILDIDPNTPGDVFDQQLERYVINELVAYRELTICPVATRL